MICATSVAARMNKNAKKDTIVVTIEPNRVHRAVRPIKTVMNARQTPTMYMANIQWLAVCTLPRSSWIDCGIFTD